MILTYIASRCLILSLCFFISMAQPDSDGFIENPSSISVDRGERANFSCTYQTSQLGLPTIMWTTPSGISVMPTTIQINDNTLRSNISFIAANSSYAGDYQCTVSSDGTTSDPATLTVNSYTVEFGLPEVVIPEAADLLALPVDTTARGSPSRIAVISFTRTDNGPAINNLTVNMTGTQEVKVQIPNDAGNSVFSVTMFTTNKTLVIIGKQKTVTVIIGNPPNDALLQRASIAIVIFSIVIALHQSITM